MIERINKGDLIHIKADGICHELGIVSHIGKDSAFGIWGIFYYCVDGLHPEYKKTLNKSGDMRAASAGLVLNSFSQFGEFFALPHWCEVIERDNTHIE